MDNIIKPITHINNILLNNNIKINIQYVENTFINFNTIKNQVKNYDCVPFYNETDIYIYIYNYLNEEIIGVLIIELFEKCLYISYMCINNKYRNMGFGAFLGYIAIIIAKYNNCIYVIAEGISADYMNTNYNRISIGKKIVVSQNILIQKLGFVDLYKLNTYNKNKIINISNICNSQTAETFFLINDENNIKFNNYIYEFENNAINLFLKYNKLINNKISIGGKKQKKNKKKTQKKPKK